MASKLIRFKGKKAAKAEQDNDGSDNEGTKEQNKEQKKEKAYNLIETLSTTENLSVFE